MATYGHQGGGAFNEDQRAYYEEQARIKGGHSQPTPVIDQLRKDIADMDHMRLHDEATGYFNQLVLDLKKQLLGVPHDPITMERLEESTKHFNELDQCRKRTRFYR